VSSPVKAIDAAKVQVVLEELGVTEASELSYCNEDQISRPGSLLKPVPQANFLDLLLDLKKKPGV